MCPVLSSVVLHNPDKKNVRALSINTYYDENRDISLISFVDSDIAR